MSRLKNIPKKSCKYDSTVKVRLSPPKKNVLFASMKAL